MRSRFRAWRTRADVQRRELRLVGALLVLGLLVRLAFLIATRNHELISDELVYNEYGVYAANGQWFFTTVLTDVPAASAWKPPGYPLFLGIVYSLVDAGYDRALFLQTLICAPATIVLTWLLGRRLFDWRVGVAAAALIAVHPFAWQYEVRLYPESVAVPLSLGLLLIALERPPTRRVVLGGGVLLGICLLTRSTFLYLVPALLAAWWPLVGLRRAALATAGATLIAVVMIAPWTARNAAVFDTFIPLSVQDGVLYGVFNDEAAHDDEHPWAWRPTPESEREFLDAAQREGEVYFLREGRQIGLDYLEDHPEAALKAFFWNGLSRFWDIRTPSQVLYEVDFQPRSRAMTVIGLVIYWAMLPLALIAIWRLRRRTSLVAPLLAMSLGASLVFTIVSSTRYRVPFEPLLAILAMSLLVPWWRARRGAPPEASRVG